MSVFQLFSDNKKNYCESIRLKCQLNFEIPEIDWRRCRYTHLFHMFIAAMNIAAHCSLFATCDDTVVVSVIHYDLKRYSLDKNLHRMRCVCGLHYRLDIVYSYTAYR